MIPGTLCDARLFEWQARRLREAASVVCVDWQHLKRLGDPVEALLRKLPPRFSLAGFSLGGLWAVQMLARAPERIERLALIASNAEAANRSSQRRSARLWRLWRSQGPAAVARECKPAYFHHVRQRKRHARLVHEMALNTPTPLAHAQFDWAARRPDGLKVLSQVVTPTLFVSGAHDRLCPRSLQLRMLAAAPFARWTEIPRCGHFLPLESPVRLSNLLRAWLAEPTQDLPGEHP